MISANHIDRLAFALVANAQLREGFLIKRTGAITEYNNYVRRFEGKPIELTPEEMDLICSIQADTLQEFCQLLEMAVNSQTETYNHNIGRRVWTAMQTQFVGNLSKEGSAA